MFSKIEGLSPPAGTISISSYAGMDGSYLNNAFIEKRNVVIPFEMRGPAKNPTIYNSVTDEYMQIQGNIQEGDKITITTRTGTKSNTAVVMTYTSGVTEKGEMYLIPADGKASDDTVQNYIYTSVFNGNRYEQKFWWLDCSEFISHLIPCRVPAPGNYYLCWPGRSDNTHPVISDITIIF